MYVYFPLQNVKNKTPCLESLLEIQGKIDAALASKKRAALLFEKLPDLKKYIDHAYTDSLTLSDDARAETVLTEADFLKEQATLLQKLKENEQNIQSEHISAVPKHTEKLQTLSQIQLDQQDTVAHLNEESRKILNSYNNIVSLLSKQFVMWDETLTKLEMQASRK
ncbi:dynactin subunit 3-like protein [Elysia marginata]|uniref:Dynactin subunit 3-like protein n=1 Tax=Elysia marginata TaxID=1093978 RepID=A0AAV4I5N4_9GAST|nr:dynactin subunit 3-like protein [Elysia marginata]